jgi:mannose-6-phosphate isomerase-like protein (cupin superfamily)
MGSKHLQHKKEKVWGYEIFVHNSKSYCGKILVLKKGKKSSLHYHIKKKETFYIQRGKLLMRIVDQMGNSSEFTMQKGDSVDIDAGVKHQFVGIDEVTEIIEFSTQHFDEDTIRVEI